jgi:hypothetical protein
MLAPYFRIVGSHNKGVMVTQLRTGVSPRSLAHFGQGSSRLRAESGIR